MPVEQPTRFDLAVVSAYRRIPRPHRPVNC